MVRLSTNSSIINIFTQNKHEYNVVLNNSGYKAKLFINLGIYDWFGLVSLFNGISTILGYLMPKPFPRRTVVVLFNP